MSPSMRGWLPSRGSRVVPVAEVSSAPSHWSTGSSAAVRGICVLLAHELSFIGAVLSPYFEFLSCPEPGTLLVVEVCPEEEPDTRRANSQGQATPINCWHLFYRSRGFRISAELSLVWVGF